MKDNDIDEFDDDDDDEDTQKGKFLTFLIGDEAYGIGIQFVTEIIGILPIAEIPELPDYIRGIINLRGKIIPVMDVRLRFKKPFQEYNGRTCIIVINIQDKSVGLIVDSVAEVINIADENIVPPPTADTGFSNRYINGIGKVGDEVKLLLDCDKLLAKDDLKKIGDIK
ncbi:MAG: chemotaxis protein CheW [Pleomorphochaeta sp.]